MDFPEDDPDLLGSVLTFIYTGDFSYNPATDREANTDGSGHTKSVQRAQLCGAFAIYCEEFFHLCGQHQLPGGHSNILNDIIVTFILQDLQDFGYDPKSVVAYKEAMLRIPELGYDLATLTFRKDLFRCRSCDDVVPLLSLVCACQEEQHGFACIHKDCTTRRCASCG
jgi:hypothetical protein